MFGSAGVRVDGFMGTQSPPGGLKNTDIAVCTIEKANNLINRFVTLEMLLHCILVEYLFTD